jgi:hypothetical protein
MAVATAMTSSIQCPQWLQCKLGLFDGSEIYAKLALSLSLRLLPRLSPDLPEYWPSSSTFSLVSWYFSDQLTSSQEIPFLLQSVRISFCCLH